MPYYLEKRNYNLGKITEQDKIMFSIFKKSDKATDPICLMKVTKGTAKFKQTYKTKAYYFCSENCLKEFKLDPNKYAD